MLYHYTSLATFALILTTKSIKFNRLDLVDDPDESLFGYGDSDMKLNSSSFVSCWTEDKVENIALWKLYTDLKGVRIGLDKDMFVVYKINDKTSFLKERFYRDGHLAVSSDMNNTEPCNVKYDLKDDNDAVKCYKEYAVSCKNGDILLHTNEIGIHKKKYWDFQKEARFIIRGMSVNEKGAIIDRPLERESFYIPLKWEAMKKMQVVLGPKAGEGERAIVDALLYKIFQDDHDIDVKKSVVRIR